MVKRESDSPGPEEPAGGPDEGQRAHFEWQTPHGQTQQFVLTAPEITIGRQSASDLAVTDPRISRRQAKLVRTGGTYELIDLGSSYGTFVNGRRIERRTLAEGDRVTFGKDPTPFVYRVDPEPGTAAPPGSSGSWIVEESTSLGRELPSAGSDLEKVLCVLDFQQQWLEAFTPETAFEQILESAVRISGAERGFILMRKARAFRYASGRNDRGQRLEESGFRASQTAVARVIQNGHPLIMIEGIDPDMSSQQSIVALRLRALACLPLRGIPAGGDEPEILGILYLDSTKSMHSLSGLDERILTKLAVEAGNVLERVETLKTIEQRKTIEADLARAEETQNNLLPREIPSLAGFDLRAYSKPTRFVGGDFYHFQKAPDEDLIAVLADVSGKGIAAALVSSMLLGCLQLLLSGGSEPGDALKRLNSFMNVKRSGHFATMFLFSLALDGTTEYISAGHNPTYLFRRVTGEVEELRSTGLILGPFAFATFESKTVRLDPGDVLVAYSDGLTEAENTDGDQLGEGPVKDVIRKCGPDGAGSIHAGLLQAVQMFTGGRAQNDDITMVIAGRH